MLKLCVWVQLLLLNVTLDLPLSMGEIQGSINAIQSGRAAGPDGFPIEFLKTFSDKLLPLLLNMFNDSLSRGTLPQTLTNALITLLLKPGKDANECGSYRPISLLNADYKILAKVLAIRLETVIHQVFSEDQTGFIRNLHSFSNIRRLLNVIHSPVSGETPEMVISLDAEKAFDRVEWPYLFRRLEKFCFGSKFVAWVKLFYSSPRASVVTDGALSTESRYMLMIY